MRAVSLSASLRNNYSYILWFTNRFPTNIFTSDLVIISAVAVTEGGFNSLLG